MQNNLHISQPCPFVPKKSRKCNGGYYCGKCDKVVVDFRDKTPEEIMAAGKNTCGIFYADQLPAQKKMRFSKSLAFVLFSVFSFFGIQAKPLEGNIFRQDTTVKTVSPKPGEKKSVKEKTKKRKRYRRYGLFRRRLSGAFDF
ncbi:MAG: hypothetical protein ACKOXF_10715 [Chitinophagaceae bacterium]